VPVRNAALLALLAGLSLSLAGCPRPVPGQGDGPLTAKEKEALELTARAFDVARTRGESIWPGYDLTHRTLLIFRPRGRSFLVNPAVPPPGGLSLEAAEVDLDVWALDSAALGLPDSLPFARDIAVAGSVAFLVRHSDDSTPNNWFRLLVHEAFHDHQARQWKQPPKPRHCRYPYDDLDHAFLVRVEERLLGQMVGQAATEPLAHTLAEYLSLRGRRYAGDTGSAAREIEEYEEASEGTARYVEERYALAAGLATETKTLESLAAFFDTFRPSNLQKWKYYRTGTVLSLALDRLAVPGWKEACEQGTCLYPRAAQWLRDSAAALTDDEAAARKASYEDLRPDVDQQMQHYLDDERATLEKCAAQGRYRVRITVPQRGSSYYTNSGLTFVLPDCSKLVSGILTFVDKDFGLEIRNRGVQLEHFENTYAVAFHEDLADGRLRLDGSAVAVADGEHRFARGIAARFAGFTLDWEGTGVIEFKGTDVEIRLEAAQHEGGSVSSSSSSSR
jgi:hypothetical protein